MPDNLFADLPSPDGTAFGAPSAVMNEQLSNLLNNPGLRIERIVSTGQCSPPGFWYDQPEGEWVVVLRGQATLRFEDTPEPLSMTPGDFIDIAPHRRHRVEWTDPNQATVWLAVYYTVA